MAATVVLSQNTRMHGVFASRTNLFYDSEEHWQLEKGDNPPLFISMFSLSFLLRESK